MFLEEIIEITVEAGSTGAVLQNVATDKDDSTVVGCVIFHTGIDEDAKMINAHIQVGGQDISKPQHVNNYRSREAGYHDGYKPIINFSSGKPVRFEIRSEVAFKYRFKAQLILIKQKDC